MRKKSIAATYQAFTLCDIQPHFLGIPAWANIFNFRMLLFTHQSYSCTEFNFIFIVDGWCNLLSLLLISICAFSLPFFISTGTLSFLQPILLGKGLC